MTHSEGLPGEGNRSRILQRISDEPGIHKSELCRELNLGWGTINHHLRILEGRNEIEIEPGSRESRIFPADVPSRHKRWLALLRDDTNAAIVEFLAGAGALPVPEVAAALNRSTKVVRRHLTLLGQAGLVQQDGRAYRAADRALERVERVERLLGVADGGPDRRPEPPLRDFGTRLSREEHSRRFTAYEMHEGDTDAASSLGISAAAFAVWRREQGLAAKRSNRLSFEEEARRLLAYDLSSDDREAARRLGMNRPAFSAWRRCRGLEAKQGAQPSGVA